MRSDNFASQTSETRAVAGFLPTSRRHQCRSDRFGLTTVTNLLRSTIAHITIWLSHLHYFDEVTAVWNDWVDPDHPPVRACAQVALANKDLKVEMIVVAHVPAAAVG